jgi:hypothetical protein
MELSEDEFQKYIYYQSLLMHPEQSLMVNAPSVLSYQLSNKK